MKSNVKTSQMRTRRQSRRERPRQQESARSDRKRMRAAKTGVCNQLILMPCKGPAYIINMRACSNNWRGCAGYYLGGTGWSSSLDPSAPLRLGTCQVSASAAIKERRRKSVSSKLPSLTFVATNMLCKGKRALFKGLLMAFVVANP